MHLLAAAGHNVRFSSSVEPLCPTWASWPVGQLLANGGLLVVVADNR
jgi:hypothetical protein